MNQQLIISVINTLKSMTNEERLEIFSSFCTECGDIQSEDIGNNLWQRCQCWNDN